MVWKDALVVVKLIAMAEVQDVRSHDPLVAQHKRLPGPPWFSSDIMSSGLAPFLFCSKVALLMPLCTGNITR